MRVGGERRSVVVEVFVVRESIKYFGIRVFSLGSGLGGFCLGGVFSLF